MNVQGKPFNIESIVRSANCCIDFILVVNSSLVGLFKFYVYY